MKKIVFALTFAIILSVQSEIRKVSEITTDAFKALENNLVLFYETGSSSKTGPDVTKILAAGKNIKLFAKYEMFGFDRWFTFENNDDANQLQMGCYNGGCMNVKWYYLEINNSKL